ncbi:hypothetical protein EF918_31740 [Streptomyces sp. WAC06614]|nr:hypothetical protein EF918_31740 [Streptomyces sp. WAC06614]
MALAACAALTACGGGRDGGAAGAGAGAATSAATSAATAAAAAPAGNTARFTENGVTVALSVSDWHDAQGTLTAVFTPEKKGFHLYSTDLPVTGVEGVGRPTTVTVTGGLTARSGPKVAAEVRMISVPGVDAPVPVYPDGPVTATLPVRAQGDGDATVLLGYASCSTQEGCTIPVADRPVRLRVTSGGPVFSAP